MDEKDLTMLNEKDLMTLVTNKIGIYKEKFTGQIIALVTGIGKPVEGIKAKRIIERGIENMTPLYDISALCNRLNKLIKNEDAKKALSTFKIVLSNTIADANTTSRLRKEAIATLETYWIKVTDKMS